MYRERERVSSTRTLARAVSWQTHSSGTGGRRRYISFLGCVRTVAIKHCLAMATVANRTTHASPYKPSTPRSLVSTGVWLVAAPLPPRGGWHFVDARTLATLGRDPSQQSRGVYAGGVYAVHAATDGSVRAAALCWAAHRRRAAGARAAGAEEEWQHRHGQVGHRHL